MSKNVLAMKRPRTELNVQVTKSLLLYSQSFLKLKLKAPSNLGAGSTGSLKKHLLYNDDISQSNLEYLEFKKIRIVLHEA